MEYWIWLRTIKGLGSIIEKRLLSVFDNPKAIYNACEEELKSVYGIGALTAKAIISARSLEKAYSILNYCDKHNIKILTYNDLLYPNIAKKYDDAPTLLYYRGNIKDNFEGVAIVGSRRCSDYGKEISITAAEFLAKNNITVISGMAKGIDGYAHISCINNGGYTIAFPGSGVDICYPAEHRELMDGIIDNGAIISEFPPGTKPRAEYFPMRNRLISSWSKKILVVEASEKSGALITANIAKSQGKEVYAPPSEIFRNTGKGTNKLLLEGATIYLQPSQLLIESGSSKNIKSEVAESITSAEKQSNKSPFKNTVGLSSIEKKIIDCISDTPKSIELISSETQIDQIELILRLSEMELEGKITAHPGGRYMV
ncbi:MAG: DNA-processing protein DprA [Eubacteriales bacterium]|nr:DNA-processing protein DprA [Eubacteriales bacterium]